MEKKKEKVFGRRVYIAYRFNDINAGQVLANIGVAHKVAFDLIQEGYTPFVPHWDFLLATMFGKKLPFNFYYENSMEWLKVCDAICVVQDGKPLSNGVLDEIEVAKRLNLSFMYRKVDLENL